METPCKCDYGIISNMRSFAFSILGCCFLAQAPLHADETLRTAAEISQALLDVSNQGRLFELETSVIYTFRHEHCSAIVQDPTGQVQLFDGTDSKGMLLQEDTVSRIRGRLVLVPDPPYDTQDFHAVYETARTLRAATNALPVIRWTNADNTIPSCTNRIFLSGILRDVFQDEIDPSFTFLVVNSHGNSICAVFSSGEDPTLKIKDLIGFEVSLIGFRSAQPLARAQSEGRSRQLTPILHTHPHTIKPVSGNAPDPFSVPDLPPLISLSSATFGQLGCHKVAGTVVARWAKNDILLKTDDNRIVFASLSSDSKPAHGDRILVSGVPESNVYYIHLQHARWMELPKSGTTLVRQVTQVDLPSLFSAPNGKRRYAMPLNGTSVRVRGRFIGASFVQKDLCQFNLEDNGSVLPVDCSSAPDSIGEIPPNSVIDVTGTCIIRLESGRTIPRINNLFLVVNEPSDIRIVARPPWWTTGKLVSALLTLFTVLVCVLVWTVMLRRLAERRGTELSREKLCTVESELKTYERTRLAIELHDMLSQMLSGISMQIGTVRKFFGSNAEKALRHLDLADKTLLSCRENLRDCLWDLRNSALEEPDMDKAIRETLEPHVEDTALAIRFNIPRDRLTDNTAHAILSIIRELTVNALRHGKATSVKIAGCIENGNVLFSVADNGDGFDPAAAPGMSQGHFGLQGIRERVEGFEGEMTVASTIGRGTKVSIRLNLPKEEQESARNG